MQDLMWFPMKITLTIVLNVFPHIPKKILTLWDPILHLLGIATRDASDELPWCVSWVACLLILYLLFQPFLPSPPVLSTQLSPNLCLSVSNVCCVQVSGGVQYGLNQCPVSAWQHHACMAWILSAMETVHRTDWGWGFFCEHHSTVHFELYIDGMPCPCFNGLYCHYHHSWRTIVAVMTRKLGRARSFAASFSTVVVAKTDSRHIQSYHNKWWKGSLCIVFLFCYFLINSPLVCALCYISHVSTQVNRMTRLIFKTNIDMCAEKKTPTRHLACCYSARGCVTHQENVCTTALSQV